MEGMTIVVLVLGFILVICTTYFITQYIVVGIDMIRDQRWWVTSEAFLWYKRSFLAKLILLILGWSVLVALIYFVKIPPPR